MNQPDCLDGRRFRDMFASGTAWLEKSAPDIDAINVFPVPDGDTGTNMLLTMRSAMEEGYRASDSSASAVAAALAYGALMGARGNSGIILSQVFRGLAQELRGKDAVCAAEVAKALRTAADQAYKGVAKPAEGTMLTVMRDSANAAGAAAEGAEATVIRVMEAAVEAARESVALTPALLPALREAGVVDAGGQGIFVLLEGALHNLKGDTEKLQYKKPVIVPSAQPTALRVGQLSTEREEPYGYCTEFVIRGEHLENDRIMAYLNRRGQSVVVVGDERMVRVHVHTLDPGSILKYGVSKGTLHQVKIQNMDDQHRDYVQARRQESETGDIAIVAVASGPGLKDVFRSLGAAQVIEGGQTMNPSVRDILKAVEGVGSNKVIVLPNNKNIVQSALRVPSLTSKTADVVPARSIPQGIAALLAFNFEQGLEQNVEGMKQAMQGVRTVEITRAVRSTRIGDIKVKKGQTIGLLDDSLVAAGDSLENVLQWTVEKAGLDSAEVVTLYYGAGVGEAQARQAAEKLSLRHKGVEFEVVKGDQPHYYYIVSVE